MAQRRALRVARRARGVLDVDRVARLQRAHPLRDRVGGQVLALGDDPGPVVGAEVDDPLERVRVDPHLVDHRAVVAGLERLGREQQPQAGLVQRVGELVRAVGRVDVDQDRADLGGGVLHQRPLGAVRRPDADPVALRDPGRDQPPGERVDVGVERRPGPAATGGHLDQRLAVPVRRDRALEVAADRLLEQRHGVVSPSRVGLHVSQGSERSAAAPTPRTAGIS